MFFPYFISVPTLSTLHCISCLLLNVPVSTVPLAFLSSLHVSSSFPVSPSLLPPPPPPPRLHVPASLASFFLTPTCMYSYLFSTYFKRMRESFHPWWPFMFFVCSLYTLINLCVLFCSVLLSSHGPDGPELFMIDPSGVSWVKKYIYLIFCIKTKNVVIGMKLLILTKKKL